MPQSQCGLRLAKLGSKAAELRLRRSELNELVMSADASNPTPEQLAMVQSQIKQAIESGETTAQKGLLRNLVADIQVAGRHAITPRFRVPVGPVPESEPLPIAKGERYVHRQCEVSGPVSQFGSGTYATLCGLLGLPSGWARAPNSLDLS